jgi:hypothetical protein
MLATPSRDQARRIRPVGIRFGEGEGGGRPKQRRWQRPRVLWVVASGGGGAPGGGLLWAAATVMELGFRVVGGGDRCRRWRRSWGWRWKRRWAAGGRWVGMEGR